MATVQAELWNWEGCVTLFSAEALLDVWITGAAGCVCCQWRSSAEQARLLLSVLPFTRLCIFWRKTANAFENGMSDGLSEPHLKIISYETTTNARGPTTTLKITRLLSMLGWRDGLQQPCRQHKV